MDIQNSGVIACLRAQRSTPIPFFTIYVLLRLKLFLIVLFSAEVAIEAARAALRGGISVVSFSPTVNLIIGVNRLILY